MELKDIKNLQILKETPAVVDPAAWCSCPERSEGLLGLENQKLPPQKPKTTQKNTTNPIPNMFSFTLTTFSRAKMSTMGRAGLRINKVLLCKLWWSFLRVNKVLFCRLRWSFLRVNKVLFCRFWSSLLRTLLRTLLRSSTSTSMTKGAPIEPL